MAIINDNYHNNHSYHNYHHHNDTVHDDINSNNNPQTRNTFQPKKVVLNFGLKMSRSTTSKLYLVAAIIVLVIFTTTLSITVDAKQHDGKLANKLDEYHSTIKCMLNIAEETLPELNDYMTCCGFWAMHDWILDKVDNECESDNLKQVKHLAGLMVPHVRDQCLGYEHGSFTCRLLVIMPITIAIIFILAMVSICVCAQVSCYKWMRVRRKYRKTVNNYETGRNGDQLTPALIEKKPNYRNNNIINNDSPPPSWFSSKSSNKNIN